MTKYPKPTGVYRYSNRSFPEVMHVGQWYLILLTLFTTCMV